MSLPQIASGFVLHRVWLCDSAFRWRFDAEPIKPVSEQEHEHGRLRIAVQRVAPPRPGDHGHSQGLSVKVTAVREDQAVWEAHATFIGEFDCDESVEPKLPMLMAVNVPAMLYSFAREHIADLARRADYGASVLLPPMRFAAP